jgi:class II poly(R)-hydroxyalkanoic acid synthase
MSVNERDRQNGQPGKAATAGPPKTAKTASAASPASPAGESAVPDATEAAEPLDLLLPQGGIGALRRFQPDSSVVRYAARLARRPGTVTRRAGALAGELGKIAVGTSKIEAPRRDRRFADPAWNENPLLKRAVQAYLAIGQAAEGLLTEAELDWRDNERMKFLVTNLVAASAPSNYAMISPVAWKALIDTGGLSAVRGVRALVSDMSSAPHIPTMVAPDAFEVGKDLAVTPGAVVHRSDVCELIQYEPTTPTVHSFPVLMVPPMINKYYVTDLAPGRSMIEFFVGQGYQVFVMSWRNPGKQHRDWDLDTYGGAVVDALAAVRSITKAPKVNICGLCAGGIVSAMVCAHLSATGQLGQVASLCLAVTVLDQSEAGAAVALMNEGTAAASVLASKTRGYMDGRSLAEVFAWLRPDDLIWNYWVNNYLQGKPPPAFDILFWNADTTRMPAGLHRNFVEIALANALTKPGEATMLGSRVDLSKIDADSYVVAGIADHIVPWPSAYRNTQLLGGNPRFVLSTSGHIASMVNPPSNPKSTYRLAAGNPPDPQEWLAAAETVQGTWWSDYTSWLADRSGGMKQRPRKLGSAKFPPLQPAPGTYILQR